MIKVSNSRSAVLQVEKRGVILLVVSATIITILNTITFYGPVVNNTQCLPALSDLVAETDEESPSVVLGTGFGGITDMKTGQGGFLYALTFDRETGEGNL